jgi:hypothetical protein
LSERGNAVDEQHDLALGRSWVQRGWKKQQERQFAALLLCLLIALALRVGLVIHTHGMIDGDEALVGIQAEHILRGARPIYFYGQAYMGSLEAYLMALIFAIAGPSVWTLRAEPILLSLLVVWLTWRLAADLARAAHLPIFARGYFTIIAGLCAAVAPLYDTVLELRTLGGYVEAFVLMLLLLLALLRLTRRWRAGVSWAELAWRWAGIGLLMGLGLWVNPLIIVALMTAAGWIGGYCLVRVLRMGQPLRSLLLELSAGVAALPAFGLGYAPALYWGATHDWANVLYFLHRGGGSSLSVMASQVVPLYAGCVAPRVIGGELPGASQQLASLHALPLALGALCMLATLAALIALFFWQHPLLLQIRRLVALPALFASCSALFFCVSSGPFPCALDLTGRYATPLMLVLPFFCATALTTLALLRIRWNPGAALSALLLVAFSMQAATYGLADAGRTFQSPYCTSAPRDTYALIAYLRRERIGYVWANNWTAYPLDFETDGSIIAADPRPLMTGGAMSDRLPAYAAIVRRASRASMIISVPDNAGHPQLLSMLDRARISYTLARFPVSPGMDVLIVTPLNHGFAPYEQHSLFDAFTCKE